MPINHERRESDLARALILMVEAQGDEQLNGMAFSASQSRFQSFIPTTWRELLDEDLIAAGLEHARRGQHGERSSTSRR